MKISRLWGVKWLSQCHVISVQGLKEATMGPNDATLPLRGPRKNHHMAQKVKCHGSVGKAARESKAYCTIANTMLPSLTPGNRASHLSLRANGSKRGTDISPTSPKHKATNFTTLLLQQKQKCQCNTSYHWLQGYIQTGKCSSVTSPSSSSLNCSKARWKPCTVDAGALPGTSPTATQWWHCLSGTQTSSRWVCTATPEVLKPCL